MNHINMDNISAIIIIIIVAFLANSLTEGQQIFTYSGTDFNASTLYLDYQTQQNALFAQLNSDKRIVGGVRIPISAAPYQVALNVDQRVNCGGVILNSRWILTAAHCVQTRGRYVVRVGSSSFKRGGQRKRVSRIIVHPRFSLRTLQNDLALVKLTSALRMGRKVQAIKLPATDAVPHQLLVSGWGTVRAGARQPQGKLRAARVAYVSPTECARDYARRDITITSKMLCAASPGRDHCFGDSGGPLVYQGVTYGVVSFAIGCASPNYPGVYTRVSRYVKWIARVVRRN